MKTTEPFSQYFPNEQQSLTLIKRILKENEHYYSKIRTRIVLIKTINDEQWVNGHCVFQAFSKSNTPEPATKLLYEKFQFLEYWLDFGQFLSQLERLKLGVLEFDGNEIHLKDCNQIGHFEFKQGVHSKNPMHYFQADCRSRPNFFSHEPIISSTLPVFPSAHSAIRNWTGVQNMDANSHLFGSVMIFLPEFRAWINKLEYLEDGIEVEVRKEKEDLKGLKIKGIWEVGEVFQQFAVPVGFSKIRIKAPEKSTGFNFYLIDDDENVFDYQQEISGWSVGQKNVLPFLGKKDSELAEEKIIKDALESGEGLQIEYKAFIKRGDFKKIEELIETTVAFLNSSGGRVLIGVNDNCVIHGIEKEVITKKETSLKELEEYCGFIRQIISGSTEKTIEFSVTLHKFDEHWIVLVNVSPGKERPYQSKEKLMFMVRRGASNKRATAEEIRTMIYQSENKSSSSEQEGVLVGAE